VTRLLSASVRASAFVRKEAVEVIRQPRLLVTLIIGPFVILLLFGAGLRDEDPPYATVFVAPGDAALATEVRGFVEEQTDRVSVQGITHDEAWALRQLQGGRTEMVVVFPEGVEETLREDEQAVITLHHNQMDPIEARALLLYLREAVDQINRQLVASTIADAQADTEGLHEHVTEARQRLASARAAADDGDDGLVALELARLRTDTAVLVLALGSAAVVQDMAGSSDGGANQTEESLPAAVARFSERVESIEDTDGFRAEADELEQDLAAMEETLAEFRTVSAEVLAGPFRGELRQLAGNEVELSDFYAPAVVVVLLQHFLVTFVSLSLVRERELGTTELYRVAPLRVGELLLGKYLAYTTLAAAVGFGLISALVLALGVPMRGSWAALVLVLVPLLVASCGLGLCIASVSRTDSQAVQYTMLVLLATVFFSGFMLSLDRFLPPFHWLGYLLPASYGIDLLRPIMLSGVFEQQLPMLFALSALGLALGALGWFGMSRQLRQA
jgi:ABC-2 type transport system permease protein